jgi:hypothetical protein
MESVSAHLMAARAAGAPAIVRIPSADVAWIKRVLESGAAQAQSANCAPSCPRVAIRRRGHGDSARAGPLTMVVVAAPSICGPTRICLWPRLRPFRRPRRPALAIQRHFRFEH